MYVYRAVLVQTGTLSGGVNVARAWIWSFISNLGWGEECMEPLCTYWSHTIYLAAVIWLSSQKHRFSQREPHLSTIFLTCCSFKLSVIFTPVLFTDGHHRYAEP